MSLLPIIWLAILIYIALLIPLFLGIFIVYFVCKQLNLRDVSIGITAKIISFNALISFIFFAVFAAFAVRPLIKFNAINSNPYLTIFVLLGVLATFVFFIFIHFKTFSLFLKGFYDVKQTRKIILYITTTAATYFLLAFYLPVLRFALIAGEMASRS